MKQRVSAEYGLFLPPRLRVQSVFLRFPKHVLALLCKVAVNKPTMVNKIFLASKDRTQLVASQRPGKMLLERVVARRLCLQRVMARRLHRAFLVTVGSAMLV